MSRKCMPLFILIEIIQFGITVQDSTGRYVQNGERNCLELMPDFATKKMGKAKSGIIQMLTQCMLQKNPNQCIKATKVNNGHMNHWKRTTNTGNRLIYYIRQKGHKRHERHSILWSPSQSKDAKEVAVLNQTLKCHVASDHNISLYIQKTHHILER